MHEFSLRKRSLSKIFNPARQTKIPLAMDSMLAWDTSEATSREVLQGDLGPKQRLPPRNSLSMSWQLTEKKNYSMEHNTPMALQFYSCKRCLLPAHPVSSRPLHQCLFFCILGMCEYVRFVNFQSERLWYFNPFTRPSWPCSYVQCFCGLKISFPRTVGALCCNVQTSTNLSPKIISEFTITCRMPDMGQSSGTLPSSKPQKFLLVCYRLKGCFPLGDTSWVTRTWWHHRSRLDNFKVFMSDSKDFVVSNLDREYRPQKLKPMWTNQHEGCFKVKSIQRKMDIHSMFPLFGSRNRTSLVSSMKQLLAPSCKSYPSPAATRSQKNI